MRRMHSLKSKIALVLNILCFAILDLFPFGYTWAQDTHNVDGLCSLEDRLQSVYKNVAPAIVSVVYGKERKLQFGSGVIVTSEGHIAISGPVQAIVKDDLLDLRLYDGRRVHGKALGWSDEFEFGLLKIAGPGPWPHVDLTSAAGAKAGGLCIALGHSKYSDLGYEEHSPSVRLGTITKSALPFWLSSSHRFNAGAYCVFDLNGRLLGLTCKVPLGGDPLHTSADLIKSYWDDLVAGKNLDRVRLYSDAVNRDQTAVNSHPTAREGAIDSAKAASVRIRNVGKMEQLVSGVIVTSDGYVITCGHHERMPGQKLSISLLDDRETTAVVLGTNLVTDIGLLKITDEGPWPHVEMGYSATVQPGDDCILIGYPRARSTQEPWILKTHVIQPTNTLPRRDDWYCQFWTSEFPQSLGGVSGGGVFDHQGHVIGVMLGGVANEMQHCRIELFRKQWGFLAASHRVDMLDASPLGEIARDFEPIAKGLPPIVVEVLVDGKQRALGTIVGLDGLVLTNATMLADGAISCRLPDRREVSARVQKQSMELDLAVLKIDAVALAEPPWCHDNNIRPGTLIAAILPDQKVQAGIVTVATGWLSSADKRMVRAQRDDGRKDDDMALGTDILLAPVSYGGPVIDKNGHVIGIMRRAKGGGFVESTVIRADIARKFISK